jgi:hypothetical protein
MELNLTNPPTMWVAWIATANDPVRPYVHEVKMLNAQSRVVEDDYGNVRTLYAHEQVFAARKGAHLWIADELNRLADGLRNAASQYEHLAHAVEVATTDAGEEVLVP